MEMEKKKRISEKENGTDDEGKRKGGKELGVRKDGKKEKEERRGPFGKPQSLKHRFLFPNSFEKILRHTKGGCKIIQASDQKWEEKPGHPEKDGMRL